MHGTTRTAGSELFVNPLMGVYFAADLPALAAGVGYLAQLATTNTAAEVAMVIEAHQDRVPHPTRQSTSTGSSSRPYTMDTLRNDRRSSGTASRRFGKRRIRAGYAVRSSMRASSAPMQRWIP
ncbi:hypothetical protein SAMN04489727_5869 [Amycolatopsis tolypomycina]|uniref:Uncharacterized protein n=1 Tax=Amycolatopsis tolypomycina TaxID=208445 RepID=A0A1H4WYV6_9PSEU|nr:hypothetical protein SAMN04489727_5869 [Amycolatopsis tolypomycina]